MLSSELKPVPGFRSSIKQIKFARASMSSPSTTFGLRGQVCLWCLNMDVANRSRGGAVRGAENCGKTLDKLKTLK